MSEKSLCTVAMFSKQEQRRWIKIECAKSRDCTARQCHQGLQQACGASALPYRTVARWVKAFKEGRKNVSDMPRSGHPPVSDNDIHAVSTLVETGRNFTIRKLAQETGLAPSTVLHILKDRLGMRKIASKWVPRDVTELELRYDTARSHSQRYVSSSVFL